MKTKPDPTPLSAVESCPAVRIAVSELVAVDRCSCGVLRVHLGALTLRVTPEGLHSIVHTLGEALIADAAVQRPADPSRPAAALAAGQLALKGPRGQS